jgi:ATP-dependent Clp protease ATP-binding subunit ClpA
MGARPLSRTIDEMIKKPLSKEILFGNLVNGGIVEVTSEKDQITLKFPKVLDIEPVIDAEPVNENQDN